MPVAIENLRWPTRRVGNLGCFSDDPSVFPAAQMDEHTDDPHAHSDFLRS